MSTSNEAERQFRDSIAAAKRYLESARTSSGLPEISGYLMAASESVGSAVAHLAYLSDVDGVALAQCRGLQDRLHVAQRSFRDSLTGVPPKRTASRLKRRLI